MDKGTFEPKFSHTYTHTLPYTHALIFSWIYSRVFFSSSNFPLPTGEEKYINSVYIIENMDRHKGGVYICTANNGVGQVASSQINLHVLCKYEWTFIFILLFIFILYLSIIQLKQFILIILDKLYTKLYNKLFLQRRQTNLFLVM